MNTIVHESQHLLSLPMLVSKADVASGKSQGKGTELMEDQMPGLSVLWSVELLLTLLLHGSSFTSMPAFRSTFFRPCPVLYDP